jgi:RNA polymerase sigma-32 factor
MKIVARAAWKEGRHLGAEEERALAGRWRARGDEAALGRLVAAHLGLVIKTAATEFRNSGASQEDLVGEGSVGLTIAARRFDPARGTRLSTYATFWIRACMMEFVVRSHGPVRVGTTREQRKVFFNLARARRALEASGGRADDAAVAAALGVKESSVAELAPRLSGRDVSLDAPRSDDDRRGLGAFLVSGEPTPEDLAADLEEGADRRRRVREALGDLGPRDRAILRARYLRARPETLASVGRRLGLSRERVRQLEERAKRDLRRALGAPAADDAGTGG